ncbi:MAG: fasciclin domain-containing protein, partial [Chloroflexota bacterium]|nr:fasciclin domain-containing protein [Chloroflexota bacterium]
MQTEGFATLVAAIEAADLVADLQADGPFTLFAPSDEAFANLPAGTLDDLLADPDA